MAKIDPRHVTKKMMSVDCDMCDMLVSSGTFSNIKCPKCGTQIRDNDDASELDRCEQWLSVRRFIYLSEIYGLCHDINGIKLVSHTDFACDIYLCNYAKHNYGMFCDMYTLREVCKNYGVDEEIIYKLRRKIDRPTHNVDPKYKHTVHALYRYGSSVSAKNVVTCTDVVEEYLRFIEYHDLMC